MKSTGPGLLDGVKVVELGQSLAGPWAGTIMADLGAAVIKVEAPKGDSARGWGPPFVNGAAAVYHYMNRNKAGLVLDLAAAADKALFARLIDEADVFVHNMRPGTVGKLGIDATALRTRNPRLVYGDMTAFGPTGPLAGRPGYEMALQAYGGIMSITGTEDGGPVRAGPSLNDFGTGMWTAIGVLAALVRRATTGEGCVIETSLLETAVSWLGLQIANYVRDGEIPKRMGSGHALICPYGAFRTADEPIIIAIGSDPLFRRLATALGHPEWADDPRFRTNADRLGNREAIDALVQGAVEIRPREYWLDHLAAAEVPCTPIQNVADLTVDEQVAATGILMTPPDADKPMTGLPLSVDGTRPVIHFSPPGLEAATALTDRIRATP
ncbi:MAG: CoA transferase, partial [Rhodospirillaceae bacterium]